MNRLLRIGLIIIFPLIAALVTYWILNRAFYAPLDKNDSKLRLVEIEPEKNFSEICNKLKEANVLRYCWSLSIMARARKLDTGIKAGEYEISPSMTPKELLLKLTSGEVLKRSVIVKEGDSIWQVGEVVEKVGLMPKEEFNKALVDQRLLALAGVQAQSFEGYLFPETYHFSRPIKAQQIIWRMLEEGEKRWPEEYSKRAEELHLSRSEVLTLASIVQKESGNVEEQPVIASVFHNRLSKGMRLQSDPTVIYGIANFNGNLTREDLETNSPYNTYLNYGLPPGPICNPGDTAIRATLFPAETSFLFFVADGKGSHVFSTTRQEHEEAVRRYQIEPARQQRAAEALQAQQP